jgi:hypothetical protein
MKNYQAHSLNYTKLNELNLHSRRLVTTPLIPLITEHVDENPKNQENQENK